MVRCIALGSTDGLKRNLLADNTGRAISVPVGIGTLGRIMDVLGNPIDERGPVSQELTASIHRKAPAYDELSPSQELLETGIKVIDLVCPWLYFKPISPPRFCWGVSVGVPKPGKYN